MPRRSLLESRSPRAWPMEKSPRKWKAFAEQKQVTRT